MQKKMTIKKVECGYELRVESEDGRQSRTAEIRQDDPTHFSVSLICRNGPETWVECAYQDLVPPSSDPTSERLNTVHMLGQKIRQGVRMLLGS